MLTSDLAMSGLIEAWNRTIPNTFDYNHLSVEKQEEITGRINSFYFGSESTPTNQLDRNNLIHVSE